MTDAIQLAAWGVAAFALSVIFLWSLNPLARHLRLVDHPAGRKDHAHPTPVTGGIAMLLAILVGGAGMLNDFGPASLGFGLAAIILVVMGALDDRFDLPWWLRILIQAVAALVLVYVGDVRIERLGAMFGPEITSIGAWSVPFTVFAVVGAINAVNMIDGADGLAGLLVLACLAMLGFEALYVGDAAVYTRVPILLGAVAGFLVFNLRWPGRRQATAFMGNSGSALLGLIIACFICRFTQNIGHPVDPVLALWLLPVPLIDCLVLMLRRLRHGHSPFAADHNHIHHLMREAGFGPTRSALVLVAFSFACWGAAGFALHMHVPEVLVFAAFVVTCLLWFWATSRRARVVGVLRFLCVLTGKRPPRMAASEQAHPEAP